MALVRLVLCAAIYALTSGRTANEMLEEAEDQATEGTEALVGYSGLAWDASASWADAMTTVQFAEGGVDDEVLPYIPVGASEAELKEAPAAKGMAVLHRKQRFAGLQINVLENQLVVLSGMESGAEKKAREAAGLGFENKLASELACHPINGTAMFMLAYRRPMEGKPHAYEISFFDQPLWSAFVEYMKQARESASIFGGVSPWAMKIHWNVLPLDARAPWVIKRPQVRSIATPTLLPPSADMS